ETDDLLDQWLDLQPGLHRADLAAAQRLAEDGLLLDVDGPALQVGPRRPDHRATGPLDGETEDRRLPSHPPHAPPELGTLPAAVIAGELVPARGEQAFQVGGVGDLGLLDVCQVRPQAVSARDSLVLAQGLGLLSGRSFLPQPGPALVTPTPPARGSPVPAG